MMCCEETVVLYISDLNKHIYYDVTSEALRLDDTRPCAVRSRSPLNGVWVQLEAIVTGRRCFDIYSSEHVETGLFADAI